MKKITSKRKTKYAWDEQLGVVTYRKNGYKYQAIQLLHFPASMNFRRLCGKLLVEALNRKTA